MIKSVYLENWKSHGQSEFEFGKGTNVIIGPIGAGKSSVMDAICYSLFGTFPGLNAKRVSIEEVIMAKPNKMENSKIAMGFSYNNNQYTVERTIKRRGTNEAMFYCNNKLVAGPKTSDVNEAIERELEISYDLFSRAVYSEQNQMDFFLRLSPSQRKEKFDELLELDKYEKARSTAVSAGNRIKAISSDKKKWANELKRQANEQELILLHRKIAEKQEANSTIAEKNSEMEKETEKIREETSALEQKEHAFRHYNELLIKARARIQENRQETERVLKEIGNREKKEIEKEMRGAKKHGLAEKEKEIMRAAEKIDSLQEKLNKNIQEKMLNEAKISELKKSSSGIESIRGKCPVCSQKLEEKTKKELLSHRHAEQKNLAAENKNLEKEKQEMQGEIERQKEARKRHEKEMAKQREEITKLEVLLSKAEGLDEKQLIVKGLEEESIKLEKEIRHIGFNPQELLEKRKQETEIAGRIRQGQKEIESNLEIIAEIKKRAETIEATQRHIAQLEKEIIALEKGVENTAIFVNALKAAQAELREMLVETINAAMQDIWPKIYPYGDLLGAKMFIEEGSYELKALQRNGEWTRVEGILSGGERSAAALCIRIAFSLVLTRNLSWLILDEPTHNLDSAAVGELGKMLRHYLPEIVEQVFVITHDKQLEKSANAAVFLLHRDKGEDGITRPEQLATIE